MMKAPTGWQRIGSVGVDSGQLMIIDPCYIPNDWDDDFNSEKEESYGGICRVTLDDGYGEVMGGEIFATQTYWGDGGYPVYGKFIDGRLACFMVDMYGDDISDGWED